MFVDAGESRAIMFNHLVNNRYMLTATEEPIRMDGLDPLKKYSIRELNIFSGTRSRINSGVSLRRTSVVLELTEVQ